VIAYDPCVVVEGVEALDHGGALRAQADFGSLIDVADVEENGVGIGLTPLADLCGATGEAAEVAVIAVVGRWQDVAVQIGGMKNGNRNGAALVGEKLGGNCGEKGALAEGAKKPASAERGCVNIHGMSVRSDSSQASNKKLREPSTTREGQAFFK